MKKPFIILFLFVIIIISLIIYSYNLPNSFSLKKEININCSKSKAVNYIFKLKNWEEINPISSKDKESIYKYTNFQINQKDTLFKTVEWESHTEGRGIMEISNQDSSSLNYTYSMTELNQTTNGKIIISEINSNQVKITWILKGKLENNPIQKYIGLLSDRIFGFDIEKSLNKIKLKLEKS